MGPIILASMSGLLAFLGLGAGLEYGPSVAFGRIMLVIGIVALVACVYEVRSAFRVRSILKSQAGIPNIEAKALHMQSDDLEERFKNLEADRGNPP